jgi:hypothetical protein
MGTSVVGSFARRRTVNAGGLDRYLAAKVVTAKRSANERDRGECQGLEARGRALIEIRFPVGRDGGSHYR